MQVFSIMFKKCDVLQRLPNLKYSEVWKQSFSPEMSLSTALNTMSTSHVAR